MPTPDQAKPMLHVSITIEATFGSEIQRDVSVKVLKEFLEAWTQNVESSHKKNKVTISLKEQAADPRFHWPRWPAHLGEICCGQAVAALGSERYRGTISQRGGADG